MKIEDDHKVELLCRLERGGIPNDPFDVLVSCVLFGLVDSHGRKVEGCNVPSLSSEPDGVAALATSNIQRAPWSDPFDERRQEDVRLRRPHKVRAFVPLIPR